MFFKGIAIGALLVQSALATRLPRSKSPIPAPSYCFGLHIMGRIFLDNVLRSCTDRVLGNGGR